MRPAFQPRAELFRCPILFHSSSKHSAAIAFQAAEYDCERAHRTKNKKGRARLSPTHGRDETRNSLARRCSRKHEGFHSRKELKLFIKAATFRELLWSVKFGNRGFAVVLVLKILLDSAHFSEGVASQCSARDELRKGFLVVPRHRSQRRGSPRLAIRILGRASHSAVGTPRSPETQRSTPGP